MFEEVDLYIGLLGILWVGSFSGQNGMISFIDIEMAPLKGIHRSSFGGAALVGTVTK